MIDTELHTSPTPSRRSLLRAAAWSAPAVAMAATVPLAAATQQTVTGNLRLVLGGAVSDGAPYVLAFTQAALDTALAGLYDSAPGNASAPEGTLDRELYDGWMTRVDDFSIAAADFVDTSDTAFFAPYITAGGIKSTVNRIGAGAVPSGTYVAARYSAPGCVIAASTSGATAGLVSQVGETTLVSRTLTVDATSGQSLLGTIALTVTPAAPIPLTVSGARNGVYTTTLTGTLLSPTDSNPADSTAVASINTYLNAHWVVSMHLQRLVELLEQHNYRIENPEWWGYPINDATPADITAIDSLVIATAPL